MTQFGFNADKVEKMIRALDDTTLEMRLPQAQATSFVLYCLTANVGGGGHDDVNGQPDDLGNAWLKSRTAGAGPYKLTEWAASDHVIIEVNPHDAEKPLMRRIVLRHVADPPTHLLMLQKGDVDIAHDLGYDQLESIGGNKNFTVTASPSRPCSGTCRPRAADRRHVRPRTACRCRSTQARPVPPDRARSDRQCATGCGHAPMG